MMALASNREIELSSNNKNNINEEHDNNNNNNNNHSSSIGEENQYSSGSRSNGGGYYSSSSSRMILQPAPPMSYYDYQQQEQQQLYSIPRNNTSMYSSETALQPQHQKPLPESESSLPPFSSALSVPASQYHNYNYNMNDSAYPAEDCEKEEEENCDQDQEQSRRGRRGRGRRRRRRDRQSSSQCGRDVLWDASITFPTDVFSMMFFARPNSLPFVYGMLVFCLQMAVLLVIFLDLTHFGEGVDDNPLDVPDDVNLEVRIAQVIAILIAGLSNTDVTRSLELLSIGWKPCLRDTFPDATPIKFIITNCMRITEGSCVIVASFIFIVQSTTVLDIFLNFAAVEFVARLDDLGYQLGREGWLGNSMRIFNSSIEGIKLPPETQKIDWLLFVKPALVLFVLSCLYTTFSGIAHRQTTGKILENTSCGTVRVVMGDQVYAFPENGGFEFETTSADGLAGIYPLFGYDNNHAGNGATISDDDYLSTVSESYKRIVGSQRLVGYSFNASRPPDLHYAYFSGAYHADFQDRESSRPIYFEDNFKDITAGMFYYCESEKSWVFTIRAFIDVGIIPHDNLRKCRYGWLMRSPPTEVFTLDEAPTENWKVWTGVLERAYDFTIICTECHTDLDCGSSSRGKCINNRCHCKDEIAEGHFCDEDRSCDDMIMFRDEQNDLKQGAVYPDHNTNPLQRTFRNIRSVVSGDAQIHKRPAYYLKVMSNEDPPKLRYELVLFTGRRWYGAYFYPQGMPIEAPDTPGKQEFFKRFHAYWNNVLIVNAKWVSEPTDSYMPTGPMKWYGFYESGSMGSYGPFPAKREYPVRFECYSVNCDIYNVCGRTSKCTTREPIIELDNYELRGNQCICTSEFEGHFCEFCKNENCTAVPSIIEEEDDDDDDEQSITLSPTTSNSPTTPIIIPTNTTTTATTASSSSPTITPSSSSP